MGTGSYVSSILKQNTLFLRNGPEASRPNAVLSDQSISNGPFEKYTTDYFCGSQVAIFIGDTWLSDVSMIQYEMSQAKRPFYGYKSQKWDLVAKGTQIIHGAFSINYTHTNFLNQVITKYLEKSQATAKDGSGAGIDRNSFSQFLEDIYKKDVSLKTLDAVDPLALPIQNNALADADFDAKANLLEQYFWGVADKPTGQYDVIPADNLPSFDIMIAFGNYAKERSVEDEVLSSHTLKILNEVHITGHALQCATTGEPIQEVYSFIARGLDSPLTRTPSRFLNV